MVPFILLLGLVSFFADITYEGARSIIGPFMGILGASGAIVGAVSGFSEFAGYAIRFPSGKFVDKTKYYWLVTWIGYTSNLIVVPLLAVAQRWETAAILIILERVGKGIRLPSRDAMLSFASKNIGSGFGFGIHEAMDRIGALIGPLVIFAVLSKNPSNFSTAFLLLGIPAACALVALFFAYKKNPHPQVAEEKKIGFAVKGLTQHFRIFLVGSGLLGAGFAPFALIAFHFQKQAVITTAWIALFYMFAMISASLFSLVGGKLFDRFSKPVVIISLLLGILGAPLIFLGNFSFALLGMLLWGIGLGMQGSILRSIVANLVASNQRSQAYGTFGMIFGFCGFLGGAALGWLYDQSIYATVFFSVVLQFLAIPFFSRITYKIKDV